MADPATVPDRRAMALEEHPRSGQPTKIMAELEAHVTHIACNEAPAGTAR